MSYGKSSNPLKETWFGNSMIYHDEHALGELTLVTNTNLDMHI